MHMRIGHGYDVHKLVTKEEYLRIYPNRNNPELVLAGLVIPHNKVLLGHSDADVIIHALMDALLGAMGLEDIGHHFPNTDERYAQISSLELLKHVSNLVKNNNYSIGNIDITLLAERPKIKKHINEMKSNLAEALEIEVSRIGLKATTNEGLGFIGREQGISAEAVVLLK